VAGGWSVGAGEGCYGNGLSKPAMRAMAGFPHDDKVFYLECCRSFVAKLITIRIS
jgi:hypothetical protein